MVRKMTNLLLAILIVGCGRLSQTAMNGEDNEITASSDGELSPYVSQNDATETPEASLPIFAETPETPETSLTLSADGIDLMIPSKEFMELRDEILINIIGIDGSLPIYHTRKSDSDYVELPYGGVLTKLGEFDYRVPLGHLNLGFDIYPAATNRLYYSDKGLELDVDYHGDVPYAVVRYLYIANTSEIKLPSGVGIGSTREDILAAYGPYILHDFHPMLTSEEVVALGSEKNGIYFVIRSGYVYSIYVGIVREDSKFAFVINTYSESIGLYPDRFYPDREYMETARENE